MTAKAILRAEKAEDYAAILSINEAAFGGSEEADLIDRLRREGVALLSLAAEVDNKTVGHVPFSRMWIDTPAESIPAAALAPVAVAPGHQRSGIGTQTIERGLKYLQDTGERIVIVVGHPTYYPRFGFSAEKGRSLEQPFPLDVFMAVELTPGALNGVRGRVRYAQAFVL